MARIAGVNIPTNKRVEISLRYIHGIGPSNAKDICAKVGIASERRVSDLTENEIIQISRSDRPRLCRRRRSPPRSRDEHQAPDGSRLLSRPAPSQGIARPRPAHAHQRPHAQRSRAALLQARKRLLNKMAKAAARRAQEGKEDRRHGRRPCERDLQQHHHHDHGWAGERGLVVLGRDRSASRARANRRPMPRRSPRKTRPRRPSNTACGRSRSKSAAPAPDENPPCVLCRRWD